ncbi:MAG: HAD family phosphatase [Promethearchaeia archaeon]
MFEQYLVIFDMDGVLADTGPIHFESWKKMAKEQGAEFTKDFFEETFGQQAVTITRKLLGDDYSDDEIERLADLKEQYYRDMVRGELEPLAGVMDLIKQLDQKGVNLGVGSSGAEANVDLLLTTLNIKDYFDVIVTAEDVEEGKPEPGVFLKAAREVSVAPRNTIVIEDAPVGIEAARRAGMKTIALMTTHNRKNLIEADLIVENLKYIDIEDILELVNLDI